MISYERFSQLLEINNLRTSDVVEKTNISASTFSDWKKGRSFPKLDKLLILSQFFNVKIEFFIVKD